MPDVRLKRVRGEMTISGDRRYGEAEGNAKAWLDHVRLGVPCRASETTEVTVSPTISDGK